MHSMHDVYLLPLGYQLPRHQVLVSRHVSRKSCLYLFLYKSFELKHFVFVRSVITGIATNKGSHEVDLSSNSESRCSGNVYRTRNGTGV